MLISATTFSKPTARSFPHWLPPLYIGGEATAHTSGSGACKCSFAFLIQRRKFLVG
jgi:hypothetical protein